MGDRLGDLHLLASRLKTGQLAIQDAIGVEVVVYAFVHLTATGARAGALSLILPGIAMARRAMFSRTALWLRTYRTHTNKSCKRILRDEGPQNSRSEGVQARVAISVWSYESPHSPPLLASQAGSDKAGADNARESQ